MENLNIPQHVAIILDGNGRWAKKRHLPRNMGHRQGSKVVEQIYRRCSMILGIKYLTVYAFSTENWKRPQDEVNALMKLLRDYLKTCIKRANKNRYESQSDRGYYTDCQKICRKRSLNLKRHQQR